MDRKLPALIGIIVAILIGIVLLPAGHARATAEPTATPAPRLAGVQSAAFRAFDAVQPDRAGAVGLEFTAHRFDTDTNAHAALAAIAAHIAGNPAAYAVDRLPRVSAPPFADESLALEGRRAGNQAPRTVAFLLIRDGAFVYQLTAVAIGGDPWRDLLAVAGRLFGGAPRATPTTDSPKDRLPGYEDLPPGFAVRSEVAATPAP